MKLHFLLFLTISVSVCHFSILKAQCTEAENSDIKKYMELTKTQDAQGCSQCAWLANLYCIAENGLFENERSEVEKTIAATKQNIKYMGEPICCPELLTKSIKWGSPKLAASNSEDGIASKSENKVVEEIEQVVGGFSQMIDNVGTSNSLDEELENLLNIMKANSELANVDPSTGKTVDYSSEEKIKSQYEKQKAVIEKHAPRLYEVYQELMNLKDQNVDIRNSILSDGMGLFNKIGSTIDVLGADSIIKKEIESMMNTLNASKERRMFDFFKSGVKADLLVTDSVVEEIINRNKGVNDLAKFQAYSIVEGWYPDMKYGHFKKLFPKFKIRNYHQNGFGYRMGDSDIYFSTFKGFLVGLVGKIETENGKFDAETIDRFQQKALEILEEQMAKIGLEVYYYKVSNDQPYDLNLTVIWTDYTTKFSSLTIGINPIDENTLNLTYVVINHSLRNEYIKNQYAPFKPMVDKILEDKKSLQ